MAYRLKTGESVQSGTRRVITEQIEKALAEIRDRDLDRADTIHQVRKRCKKIRGALRLVRGALGTRYSEENAWYRDAARHVSDLRDAEAMIETCDTLRGRFDDSVDEDVLRPIREVLEERKKALMGDTDHVDALLQDLRSAMLAGQKRVDALVLEGDGCSAAMNGLRKTYARGRVAAENASENPSPESFHEWRKRVKYHRYHMRLLRDVWPSVVGARREEAEKLGKALGDHHDLCILRALILNQPESFARAESLMTFLSLAEKRIAQIERNSRPLGCRLFAEKPKHLASRFAFYFSHRSQAD